MSYELLGKTCASKHEYEMRLERFRAWANAHPFAYRTPNTSIPACITYVYADRYEPAEAEMMRLLGHTRPDATPMEAMSGMVADGTRVLASRPMNERNYPSYALTRDQYLANPVGANA
jgi:hypothetical protein